MPLTSSDVRWIETYDRRGERIQCPDTTTPPSSNTPQQPQTTKPKPKQVN